LVPPWLAELGTSRQCWCVLAECSSDGARHPAGARRWRQTQRRRLRHVCVATGCRESARRMRPQIHRQPTRRHADDLIWALARYNEKKTARNARAVTVVLLSWSFLSQPGRVSSVRIIIMCWSLNILFIVRKRTFATTPSPQTTIHEIASLGLLLAFLVRTQDLNVVATASSFHLLSLQYLSNTSSPH